MLKLLAQHARSDPPPDSSSTDCSPPSSRVDVSSSEVLSSLPLPFLSSLGLPSLLSSSSAIIKPHLQKVTNNIQRTIRGQQNKSLNQDHIQHDDSQSSSSDSDTSAPPSPSLTSLPTPLPPAHSLLRMNFLPFLYRCEHEASRRRSDSMLSKVRSDSSLSLPLASSSPPRLASSIRLTSAIQHLQTVYQQLISSNIQIQHGKKNAEFSKRISYLSNLAEKEKLESPPSRSVSSGANPHSSSSQHVTARITANSLLDAASSSWHAHPVSVPVASAARGACSVSALCVRQQLLSKADGSLATSQHSILMEQSRHLLQSKHNERTSHAASNSLAQSEWLHTDLTHELADLSAELKENVLKLNAALKQDEKVVDESERLLDSNLVKIVHENSRLKAWASRSCSESCTNIFVIVLVWLVFILMFMFIKIFPAPSAHK